MPVAIETVIIIIVVISFAVLFAVVFALYWLWRLLLEDRRCARIGIPRSNREWPCRQVNGRQEQGSQRALLSSRSRHPRISRRNEVIVDERSRRMAPKATPCLVSCPAARPAPPLRIAMEARAPEVIVLDDTEPPPPYEAAA